MQLTYNNNLVEVEVDHSGAACDAYFSYGEYLDGAQEGFQLTNSELNKITELYQDELCEYCLEHDGYWKE